MPRERLDYEDSKRWLSFAKSDLNLARKGHLPGIRLEGLCYLAQQAAEKALKAILIRDGTPFPRTHQIRALLEHLPSHYSPPRSVLDAADLSEYAVQGRYPQNHEDVNLEEYEEALTKSTAVIHWVTKALEKDGSHGIRENRAHYDSSRKVGKGRSRSKPSH